MPSASSSSSPRGRASRRPAARKAAGALDRALALWRGAALADVAYEPFAQAAISALHELRITALEQQIETDLALGRHAEVVGRLPALIADHPYRERLRGQLMLALYRCDRQADALQAYQDARPSSSKGSASSRASGCASSNARSSRRIRRCCRPPASRARPCGPRPCGRPRNRVLAPARQRRLRPHRGPGGARPGVPARRGRSPRGRLRRRARAPRRNGRGPSPTASSGSSDSDRSTRTTLCGPCGPRSSCGRRSPRSPPSSSAITASRSR